MLHALPKEKSNLHKYYKHIVPIFSFCWVCLLRIRQYKLYRPCVWTSVSFPPSVSALSPDGKTLPQGSPLAHKEWTKLGCPVEGSLKKKEINSSYFSLILWKVDHSGWIFLPVSLSDEKKNSGWIKSWFLVLALALPPGGHFSRSEWSPSEDLKGLQTGRLSVEAEELQEWCLRGDLQARHIEKT